MRPSSAWRASSRCSAAVASSQATRSGGIEPGEDTVTLRPRRGEELLALGEPVGAEVGPHRAVVDGDDLRRLRLALRAERGEALRRDSVDRDAVEDADRQRADDGVAAHLLAGRERRRGSRPSTPRSPSRPRRSGRARRALRPCAGRPRPSLRRPGSTPTGRTSRSPRPRPPPPCAARRGATSARSSRPPARARPPRPRAASKATRRPSAASPPRTCRRGAPRRDATTGRPDRRWRRARRRGARPARSRLAARPCRRGSPPPSGGRRPSRSYVVAPATAVYVESSVSPSSSTSPR